MGTLVVLQQMAVIAVLVGIGFFFGKRGTVDQISSKSISAIVMDVCNPALMLSSVISGRMSASHEEFLVAGLLAAGFYAVLVFVGFLFPVITKTAKEERRFYNLMCVYTNVGFIGIPVAHAILPENAMLPVLMCNVMYSLLFYTHGVTILGGNKGRIKLSGILSPGTIAAILSLVIFWFDFRIPDMLADLIGYLGDSTVFLSMLLLGVSISRADILSGIKKIRTWEYIVFRMIILPTLFLVCLHLLGITPEMAGGMCLMSAMPIGNLPLIQAEKTGQDTHILAESIAISTAFSMISITVFMSFL